MYLTADKNHRPARAVQHMMPDAMAQRAADIILRRDMSEATVRHVLFNTGYGRKSVARVQSLLRDMEMETFDAVGRAWSWKKTT